MDYLIYLIVDIFVWTFFAAGAWAMLRGMFKSKADRH